MFHIDNGTEKDNPVAMLHRLQCLQQIRLSRVPPEPLVEEEHVVISVNHPILGICSRAFKPRTMFNSVYDWVGTLSLCPEYFILRTAKKTILHGEESVASNNRLGVLSMEKADAPVPLSSAFSPLFSKERPHEYVAKTPMHVLTDAFGTLKERREQCLDALKVNDGAIHVVSRGNIIDDMVALFSPTSECSFIDQIRLDTMDAASGDGVSREVFSIFWEAFLARFGEGYSQFVIRGSPSLTAPMLTALGRLITHQFVALGTFPTQLAQASMMSILSLPHEEALIPSFLALLPCRQRRKVEEAVRGDDSKLGDVCEILAEFGSQCSVSRDNLDDVLTNTAKFVIVTKPQGTMSAIRTGMGEFWQNIRPEEMSSLYLLTSVTAHSVIEKLSPEVNDEQESQVERWLKW